MSDWSLPTTSTNYTDVIAFFKARDLDVACGLDPAVVTVTGPATGMIRWNSANNQWEKYNGATWSALSATNAFGNVTVSGTLGVTGVATFTTKPILSSLTASLPVLTDGGKGLISGTMTGTGTQFVMSGGTPVLANLSVTGTIGAGGIVDIGNVIRSTNALSFPAAGAGLETFYSAGVAYLQSYNRTGAAFMPIRVSGSTVDLDIGGVSKLSISAAGAVTIPGTLGVTGVITATGGVVGNLTGTASGNLVSGGALGTPSSGVGTNITGVNAATLGGNTFAAPPSIGTTTPNAGIFTYVSARSGYIYLDGATSGFSQLMAPAVAGGSVITLPAVNSTLATLGANIFTAPQGLPAYTVAGLPAGTQGDIAYCTDLNLPGFLAAAAGGGAINGPVFRNATIWVCI
jgi:hypothetical protein